MEHNDHDKDLPLDPDATEVVAVDLEAMLHMELDAERASSRERAARRVPLARPAAGRPPKESIATIRAMRAAPRASVRMSSARLPAAPRASVPSMPGLPRPPIHTLLPPRPFDGDDDEVDPTTHVYDQRAVVDRASQRHRASSARASVASVKFPARSFSMPVAPQPFHTVPALPAAKRVAAPASPDDSQQTAYAPVLAPTSRRDLREVLVPNAMESLAPMALSAFPSVAPAPARIGAGSMFAIIVTMLFTLMSVAVMGLGVFKPSTLETAKLAIGNAMKGHQKHTPAVAAQPPPASVEELPAVRAVPPVMVEPDSAKDAGAAP